MKWFLLNQNDLSENDVKEFKIPFESEFKRRNALILFKESKQSFSYDQLLFSYSKLEERTELRWKNVAY